MAEPPPDSLPSLLPRGLKIVLRVVVALAGFMLANAAYLLLNRLADAAGWTFFAVGQTSLPRLFQAMVLAHTATGLLLALAALTFVVAHLPKVWRRRHRSSLLSGSLIAAVGLLLVVTGLFILSEAASRDNRWAWWAHVIAAALVPVGYVVHRLVSRARPAGAAFRRYAAAVAGALLVLVASHGLTRREVELTPEARAALAEGLGRGPGAAARDVGAFATAPYTPPDFVPPASPFFPSPATTTSGGRVPSRLLTRGDPSAPAVDVAEEAARQGFVSETPIGAESCVRCHPDVVAQWSVSAHRFASFNNPFYEASVLDTRRDSLGFNRSIREHLSANPQVIESAGAVKSKWCAGCHDPALLFTGILDGEVDRGALEAQAGLTCLACHAIDRLHGRTGNGNYNLDDLQEDPYLFAEAGSGGWRGFLHDMALKAKPTVHKRRLLKPLHSEPEFCGACHKVRLTEPVNDYRWLRGQDEFDNWHDSGVSRNAARTFYLPSSRRICQDCHMPLEAAPKGDLAAEDGYVRSHRFTAVNTALPYLRGDDETLRRIEDFLKDEKLSVDIFALRPAGAGEPLTAIGRGEGASRPLPVLRPGETVSVDVVVRNRGVGHTFPGGTNDSNEGWLEFALLDASGTPLAVSGAIQPDGHLDSLAHVYKAVLLDREGRLIDRRNGPDIYVAAAVNVIGPGSADVAHFEFVVPPQLAGQELTLRARLLWRKFDRRYTEFAYRANGVGFRRFADVPDLPVTEIAADHVVLAVGESSAVGPPDRPRTEASHPEAGDWTRYNDYGIALLREGNTRAARAAFEQVRAMRPERLDGPLNLARAALQDGNVDAAYRYLQEAEAIRSGDPQAAWVWGLALQEDGRYEEAILAFRRVLEEFPEDRDTWRRLGRTLYLHGEFEAALEALDRVLAIDPEDRVAHYHRMLSLRGLRRPAEAALAEAAYERYRIDEAAQAIAGAYRREHPGVNLMAQPIHTHRLSTEPPAAGPAGAAPRAEAGRERAEAVGEPAEAAGE